MKVFIVVAVIIVTICLACLMKAKAEGDRIYDELAYKFQVMSIPTLIFYKDGKLINKKVGFCDKKELLGYFN